MIGSRGSQDHGALSIARKVVSNTKSVMKVWTVNQLASVCRTVARLCLLGRKSAVHRNLHEVTRHAQVHAYGTAASQRMLTRIAVVLVLGALSAARMHNTC